MTSRYDIQLLSLIFCLALTIGQAPAQDPIGMVLMSGQGAQVERGNQLFPLQLADLLFQGDRVLAGAQAGSILYCPSNEKVVYAAGSELVLRKTSLKVEKGAPTRESIGSCAIPKVALGAENLERGGAVRIRGISDRTLILYVGGPLGTNRPDFVWGNPPDVESFRFVLYDAEGEVLWERDAIASPFEYPSQEPSLGSGLYEYEVTAFKDSRPVARRRSRLEVLQTSLDQSEGRSPDTVQTLLTAVRLENESRFSEAAAFYRVLQDEFPQDDRWARHLIALYSSAGLIDAAQEESRQLHRRTK